MYLPSHFEEPDDSVIGALIEEAPLACVIAQTAQGLLANHLPLMRLPDGDFLGHVALANDMHRLIDPQTDVLAVFRRDDAYVSPNFYPGKSVHHRHVPTWNYEVVHVHGRMTFQHDDKAKRAAVGLLTRMHERRLNGDKAWKMADAPADYMEQMLGAIVAFRLSPDRILAKSKLSQNRDERDYDGAVEGLRASGHERLAQRMKARIDTRP